MKEDRENQLKESQIKELESSFLFRNKYEKVKYLYEV